MIKKNNFQNIQALLKQKQEMIKKYFQEVNLVYASHKNHRSLRSKSRKEEKKNFK